MPMTRGYWCDCGTRFEFMHMRHDEPATCPTCQRAATDADEVLGGHKCDTIVPMSKSSLKNKAGYVHTHADRPAEKGSVSVPRKGNF